MASILDLVDRASRDPQFLRRLHDDPYGTARAAGVDASDGELAQLCGGGGAPAAELLQARLSFSLKGKPTCAQGSKSLDCYGYAGAGSMD